MAILTLNKDSKHLDTKYGGIFDLLLELDWQGNERIYGTLLHIDLIDLIKDKV